MYFIDAVKQAMEK